MKVRPASGALQQVEEHRAGRRDDIANAFAAKPESGRMIAANARLLIAAFEAAGLEFIP